MSLAAVQQRIRNYESMGEDAFLMKNYKRYSNSNFKQFRTNWADMVHWMIFAKKYGIRSKSKLQKWIKQYNGHEDFKSYGTGGSFIMTKGRKTTFDERVEIVEYCIAHNHNYAETSEKYQVSYQQVRNYTVKYESNGVEALKDRRGKRKSVTNKFNTH